MNKVQKNHRNMRTKLRNSGGATLKLKRIPLDDKSIKQFKQLAKEERLIILGQFTATIAHEINNPLDIIHNKLYLLQKAILNNGSKNDMLSHISRIEQQISRINQLTRDILNYVKPRSILLKPIDINSVIINTIDSLTYFGFDNIDLKLQLADELPKTMGDTLGLEIVFRNILINAMESFQERGEIFITSRLNSNKKIEITFQDNGAGIPANQLDKIFAPFFTSKRKTGGTGLGLTICKKIIDKHQGEIKVKSKPGLGTKVIIQFPELITN